MEIGRLMGGLVIFEVVILYRGGWGVGGGVRLGDLGEGRKEARKKGLMEERCVMGAMVVL